MARGDGIRGAERVGDHPQGNPGHTEPVRGVDLLDHPEEGGLLANVVRLAPGRGEISPGTFRRRPLLQDPG